MPQYTRHYCSNCRQSIFNCVIDGKRVPLSFYFVVGQPEDTGPQFNLGAAVAEGVKLPSVIREIIQMPVARIELCIKCMAEIFGLKLVTAEEDPTFSIEQADVNDKTFAAVQQATQIEGTEKSARLASRAIHAIRVGRGAAKALSLPAPRTAGNKTSPPASGIDFEPLPDGMPASTFPVAPVAPEPPVTDKKK